MTSQSRATAERLSTTKPTLSTCCSKYCLKTIIVIKLQFYICNGKRMSILIHSLCFNYVSSSQSKQVCSESVLWRRTLKMLPLFAWSRLPWQRVGDIWLQSFLLLSSFAWYGKVNLNITPVKKIHYFQRISMVYIRIYPPI